MLRTSLQNRRVPPLVRLGTIQDMSSVAKKLAIARKAVEGIRKIEDELMKGSDDVGYVQHHSEWIAVMAKNTSTEARESVVVLNRMRSDLEKYLKELKNALN